MTTLIHPHHSQNRNWKHSIDGLRNTKTGRYQCTRAAGDPCGCPKRKKDAKGNEVDVEEVVEPEEGRPAQQMPASAAAGRGGAPPEPGPGDDTTASGSGGAPDRPEGSNLEAVAPAAAAAAEPAPVHVAGSGGAAG